LIQVPYCAAANLFPCLSNAWPHEPVAILRVIFQFWLS
jgi:hypothetical protein